MKYLRRIGRWTASREHALIAVLPLPLFVLVWGALEILAEMGAFGADRETVMAIELVATMLLTLFFYLALLIRRTEGLRVEYARRTQAEAHVEHIARFDSLTGLPNRNSLLKALLEASARSRAGRQISLIALDIDRFRPINDIHGHEAGDRALRVIADRIHEICGNRAFAARLSGDEFACFLRHSPGSSWPANLAEMLASGIARPIELRTGVIQITASLGIATLPAESLDGERLLRSATFAAQQSSRNARGRCAFFVSEMAAKMDDRAALEVDMRSGITRGEFIPYFQPIVSLKSGKLNGFECLARWQHPQRGLVSPDIFIPIAEEAGLIQELSYAILSAACRHAREWPAELTLSINISPLQLIDSWLPERILRTLCETGFPAQRLIVEITENRLVGDFDAARAILTSLHNAGVQIALDDFGTGYSGLKHLRELQFNRVKIDRSFIAHMETQENRAIIASILRLSEGLKLAVTAEGVETQEQADALHALGCPLAQGYLFGHAEPAPRALALARQMVPHAAPQGDRVVNLQTPAIVIPCDSSRAAKGCNADR